MNKYCIIIFRHHFWRCSRFFRLRLLLFLLFFVAEYLEEKAILREIERIFMQYTKWKHQCDMRNTQFGSWGVFLCHSRGCSYIQNIILQQMKAESKNRTQQLLFSYKFLQQTSFESFSAFCMWSNLKRNENHKPIINSVNFMNKRIFSSQHF